MKITTDKLLALALKEAENRAGVVSGYVIGSAASGSPVFAGTADIDLVLIHDDEPPAPREIVTLSDEFHLDITHHSRRLYEQPRDLRLDPWLGPAMCEPLFLFDPSHFFEWAQASVRGQFHRSDNVLARAHAHLGRAQQTLWSLATERYWLRGWLSALLEAANAVACLDGFPAAGRQVAAGLQAKLAAVGHPEVYGRFIRLLGAERLEGSDIDSWPQAWAGAFEIASGRSFDPELSASRKAYFFSGFELMLDQDRAVEMLWPILNIWGRTMSSLALESNMQDHQERWAAALATLQISIDHANDREHELEELVDYAEGVLEKWAERVGS